MGANADDGGGRLLRFLARTSHTGPAPRTTDDAATVWWAELPDHPAVRRGDTDDLPAGTLLVLDPGDDLTPPQVPAELAPWVTGDPGRPGARLRLRAKATVDERPVRLSDRPHLRTRWAEWHPTWLAWSERALADGRLVALHTRLAGLVGSAGPEDEFVLGVGLLTWHSGDTLISRHVATIPLAVDVDPSGTVTVTARPGRRGAHLELDMLDAHLVPAPEALPGLADLCRRLGERPLDATTASDIAVDLLRVLHPGGRVDDAVQPPAPEDRPTITWAPALVRRPRTGTPAPLFRRLAREIGHTGPTALKALSDPDAAAPAPAPGALVEVDGLGFSPMPLTAPQARAVAHTDSHVRTVVTTPAGRERTRTVAAVVAHHLAQGHRVLVTGPAESLTDVRGAVPEPLRALVGDVTAPDLDASLTAVTGAFATHDRTGGVRRIAAARARIDLARRDRTTARDALVASREAETTTHDAAGHHGTFVDLVRIAEQGRERHGWTVDVLDDPETARALTPATLRRLHDLLTSPTLGRLAAASAGRLPDRTGLPAPATFAEHVHAFTGASAALREFPDWADHPVFTALCRADEDRREALLADLDAIDATLEVAERFPGEWMTVVTDHIRRQPTTGWHEPARIIEQMLTDAAARVAADDADVTLILDVPQLRARLRHLRDHLLDEGPLEVDPDGMPHLGVFVPDAVRAAYPVFLHVRVDSHPPVSVEDVDAIVRHLDALDALAALDDAWPDGTAIPLDAGPQDRLAWHADHLRDYVRVADLAGLITRADVHLADLGLSLDWTDEEAVDSLGEMTEAASVHVRAVAAAEPLADLAATLRERTDDATCRAGLDLTEAAIALDADAYRAAWELLDELDAAHASLAELDALAEEVQAAAPRLLRALRHDPGSWASRIEEIDAARDWFALAAWVDAHAPAAPAPLVAQIAAAEADIADQALVVAAERAWTSALTPDRLAADLRVDLMMWDALSRRVAAGADSPRRRRDLARLADRCRDAVPAWICPLEALPEEMVCRAATVDVVVVVDAGRVDAASVWVAALAPRIVLVGDPSATDAGPATGDDPARRALVEHYLHDDPHRESWVTPRSLLADALARGGQVVDLTVPDAPQAPATTSPALAARVTDLLTRRGYAVVTPEPGSGVAADLLVIGESARLGVVCEGELWDGPQAYRAELETQLAQQRAGRALHRLRASRVEADPVAEFTALRTHLERLGIRPVHPLPDTGEAPGADEIAAELLPAADADETAETSWPAEDDPDDLFAELQRQSRATQAAVTQTRRRLTGLQALRRRETSRT